MVFRREGAYGLVAVILVMGAMMLFAGLAWSQGSGSGDLAGEQADENQGPDTDMDDNIEELIIDEDCEVGRDAVIVFKDENGDHFTVENRNNVLIREINDQVVVEDLTDKQEQKEPDEATGNDDEHIEFIRGRDPDGTQFEELDDIDRELTVVSSSGIDCTAATPTPPATPPTPPPATPPPATNPDDTDGDGVISQQEQEAAEAEDELNALNETTDGETTDGEGTTSNDIDDNGSAVSASVDEGGAEASTPGAVARSGGEPETSVPEGDPDELPPVSAPRGAVQDEIATEGPLPETGGTSLLIYGMVGLGFVLMGAALVRRIRTG